MKAERGAQAGWREKKAASDGSHGVKARNTEVKAKQ